MKNTNYLKNLKELENELRLLNPLIINEQGECSLLSNGPERLWIKIQYLTHNQSVKIDCVLSHALPSELRGLQDMMSKLIFDLIKPSKKLGKLIACPKENSLSYTCEISLAEEKMDILAKAVPVFLTEAREWKKKFTSALKESTRPFSHKEEEILNFNFQIS